MGAGCCKSSEKRVKEDVVGEVAATEIRSKYRLGQTLGSGSFGQVRLCIERGTEKQFACKIMTKRNCKSSTHRQVDFVTMFRNEIRILKSIDHSHVVRLINAYEDKNYLYAVMEKCEGGELFARIVQKRRFSEQDASRLCKDMLSAISHVHSKSIVHRDIKAENFLFTHKVPLDTPLKESMKTARLVLIDFGMSVFLDNDQRYLRQVCGSPHYVAPELVQRRYRHQVDLWALGVIVFLMLYGRYPFEGSDQKQIAQKVLRSEPDYSRNAAKPSRAAISFIKGLLQKDPEKRLTPSQAAMHHWILREGKVEIGISKSISIESLEEPAIATGEPLEAHAGENAHDIQGDKSFIWNEEPYQKSEEDSNDDFELLNEGSNLSRHLDAKWLENADALREKGESSKQVDSSAAQAEGSVNDFADLLITGDRNSQETVQTDENRDRANEETGGLSSDVLVGDSPPAFLESEGDELINDAEPVASPVLVPPVDNESGTAESGSSSSSSLSADNGRADTDNERAYALTGKEKEKEENELDAKKAPRERKVIKLAAQFGTDLPKNLQ